MILPKSCKNTMGMTEAKAATIPHVRPKRSSKGLVSTTSAQYGTRGRDERAAAPVALGSGSRR